MDRTLSAILQYSSLIIFKSLTQELKLYLIIWPRNCVVITMQSIALFSDNENRTNCVNKLRGLLSGLQADHYSTYVSKVLAQNCSQEDTVCEDDRHIMLDIVARMGDVLSQDLLVQHVLSRRPPSHEDLRRVFIHCAALKSPSQVKKTHAHTAHGCSPSEHTHCLVLA